MPKTKKTTTKKEKEEKTKKTEKIEKITEKIEKTEGVIEEKEFEKIEKSDRFIEAIGRRKTAVARVRLSTRGGGEFTVNNKPYEKYFPLTEAQQIILAPLKKMNCAERFRVLVKVKGGGYHAQAEAVRHGIARALVEFNQNFRKRLRKAGYLTRDPRMRERKKFGLKRARRAPQWQKR